jgi:hypothetical protein
MKRKGGQGTHRNAPICEEMPQISISDLRKRGLLKSGTHTYYDLKDYLDAPDGVVFVAHDGFAMIHRYNNGQWLDDSRIVDGKRITGPHRIEYGRTRVYDSFVHHRVWFECPDCHRRVGILYVTEDAPVKCRICAGALNASTRMKGYERAEWQARKIRHRLGQLDPDDEAFPPKPKWQHKRTYDRLRVEHDALMRRCRVTCPPQLAAWPGGDIASYRAVAAELRWCEGIMRLARRA